MFVRVAIPIPSDKTFLYSVPPSLAPRVSPGKRVIAPFGKRTLTGYIVETVSDCDLEQVKEIMSIPDIEPLFTEDHLQFYEWASRYYIYPLGKLLKEILPTGIDQETEKWVLPGTNIGAPVGKGEEILELVINSPNGVPLKRLKRKIGAAGKSELGRLDEKGIIRIVELIKRPQVSARTERFISIDPDGDSAARLTPKQKSVFEKINSGGEIAVSGLKGEFGDVNPVLRSLEKKGLIRISEREVYRECEHVSLAVADGQAKYLNPEQGKAQFEIMRALSARQFAPYLLHGVTGSGKTEVYLNAAGEVLRKRGSVLFLVPEIALTPQLISRIRERLGDAQLAVLHSGITNPVRYDHWRRILRGEARIVVGARSAVFAPIRDLQLIIVDEEHDTSYKQEERFRYSARDLALVRARQCGAVIILGSATPAVQSMQNVKIGRYKYLQLPNRVENRPLPHVEVVDLRLEQNAGGIPLLSRQLVSALKKTLDLKGQALLFLNRRGFYTFTFCRDCGFVFRCRNCSVSLIQHSVQKQMRCHYCDYSQPVPETCPVCSGKKIRTYGAGTERVEEELRARFPHVSIARMDSDTTSRRGSHASILKSFEKGEIDLLIGTQMIAKGHDFPNILLIGVIAADTSLNFPDFRAAEKTFQLLTQVSGRCGRGDTPGQVIIQTFNPDHYAIQRARNHDTEGFFSDEIPLRQELGYPPFTRFLKFEISSLSPKKVKEKINELAEQARKTLREGISVIGPAESPLSKIKGRYRWHFLLKGKRAGELNQIARKILENNRTSGYDIKIDMDPLNFL